MIKITDKANCCGCGACVQCCPKQCITMHQDEEGFCYPVVNSDECISCGLCEKVCPILNCGESKKPLKVYAAKNKDEEIRLNSSSGGIFTALAENIIYNGGVVFGAAFDKNWNVIHMYVDNIEGLALFRGSKYVQSKIGNSYKEAKKFLSEGRDVLFSGTSCQIAGLKKYLRREYNNLIAIEILCHGVPSPLIWQSYLEEKKSYYKTKEIINIKFRDKCNSWFKYYFTIEFNKQQRYSIQAVNDPFFIGFLSDLYLRPSCYSCKCKNGRSGSDLILADYWNINNVMPSFNDDKGVSLIHVNSEKGLSLINKLCNESIECVETSYNESKLRNNGFKEKISIHRRSKFFINKKKKKDLKERVFDVLNKRTLLGRAKIFIKCIIRLNK